MKYLWQRICFVRSRSCLYRSNSFSFIATKKLRLIVTGSCNSSRHERFMRENFFQNEISENNSQKFSWPMKDWVTLIYLQLKGTSWKIDLDDFVDEFDSRHDNRRIKLHWGDADTNSNVGSARICMRIV